MTVVAKVHVDLLVVDGAALAYQAFHSMPSLTTSAGQPVGAVLGFLRTLRAWRTEYQPTHIVIVFDPIGPTQREFKYAAYKAGRAETPAELCSQFPWIFRLVQASGLALLQLPEWEADDVIGTLAERARQWGWQTLIATPDKDMMQLVDDQVLLLRRVLSNTRLYDVAAVQERYGCRPDQITDLLGLMGDSSDGIPGVPGVGEKTAARLLAEHENLESVLTAAPGIRQQRLRENLTQYADQARLSRELATIDCDAPMETSPEELVPADPDMTTLVQLLRDLELHSELTALGQELTVENDYTWSDVIIDTPQALRALAERLAQAPGGFAIDTETTSLEALAAQLVGLSVCCQAGTAYYVPIAHEDGPNLPLETVRAVLGPVLADPAIPKLGHHLKYDLQVLTGAGLPLAGVAWDTLLAAGLLDYNASHKLDALAARYLNYQMIPIEAVIGTRDEEQLLFSQVSRTKAVRYAAEDAEATWRLAEKLRPLVAEAGLTRLLETVEVPLIPVLCAMERQGIMVDVGLLERASGESEIQLRELEQKIWEVAGERFNIASTQQLAHILYDVRGLPAPPRRSTRAEVLDELALRGDELAILMAEYRQITKLKSTYLDALPALVGADGRIHTHYQQLGTITGRISSAEPNLQNIPVRTAAGRRVREAFLAGPECVLVAADYSQIELRVLAEKTGDPAFIQAFEQGWDIHTFTASEIFGVAQDQVTGDMRRKAKEINFGLNYGMTAFGLAGRLGISRSEAEQYMQRYFQRYPAVARYINEAQELGAQQGWVSTLWGRRIPLPQSGRNGHAGRVAINGAIQGTAADILKLAMVRAQEQLQAAGLAAGLALTVHDEIILEAAADQADEAGQLLRTTMESIEGLHVPLTVSLSQGRTWAELK